jgi:hypothetical protein
MCERAPGLHVSILVQDHERKNRNLKTWHATPLAAPPAVRRLDRAGVEELFRCHHTVLLEHHPALHDKLNIAQRVDVAERIAGVGCDEKSTPKIVCNRDFEPSKLTVSSKKS